MGTMIAVLGKLLDVLGFLRYVLRRWAEDRCHQIAGSLTFTTLLALAPMLAVAVSLLSRAPFFEDVMVHIKIFLLLNLVPEIAHRIITVYMEEFSANAGRLTTVGVAFLFLDYCFIFREDRRCLHDLIAGTTVVRR